MTPGGGCRGPFPPGGTGHGVRPSCAGTFAERTQGYGIDAVGGVDSHFGTPWRARGPNCRTPHAYASVIDCLIS